MRRYISRADIPATRAASAGLMKVDRNPQALHQAATKTLRFDTRTTLCSSTVISILRFRAGRRLPFISATRILRVFTGGTPVPLLFKPARNDFVADLPALR